MQPAEKDGKFSGLRLPRIAVLESPGEKNALIAEVKPEPYQVSTLAVGQQKDLARQRGEGLGFVRSQALERYFVEVRQKLIGASGVTQVPGTITVLANPAFAAYSTPDGNIYLAMGWVPYLESEDEVAAIIAHELSHVLLKHHSADVVSGMQKRGHALYELGQSAKMTLNKTRVPNPKDQKSLFAIEAASEVGSKVVMPAWGRRQEQEADLLAVDLLIRANYSPAAMATMLEKYRAWEMQTQQSGDDAAKHFTETIGKDWGKAIKIAYDEALRRLSVTHPDTTRRLGNVVEYLDRHYIDTPLSDPRTDSWNALKRNSEVKEVTRNYDMAFSARKMLEKGKARDAYGYAQSAASGRTTNDAYPNWILAKTASASGRHREAVAALQRAIASNEPIREVYDEMIAIHERHGELDTAFTWTEKASATFGDGDRWYPAKIRLQRKLGRVNEATALTLKCTVQAPDWRRLCQAANETPAPRQTR